MDGWSFSDHALQRFDQRNIDIETVRVAIKNGEEIEQEGTDVKFVLDGKIEVVAVADEKLVKSAWHCESHYNTGNRTPPKWWVDYEPRDSGFICPNCDEFVNEFIEAAGKVASKQCCSNLYPISEWVKNTPKRVRPD